MAGRITKTGKLINRRIGRAVEDYGLISGGDRILVAVSGGKDSISLLHLLKDLEVRAPVNFKLLAAHITTDFSCSSCTHLDSLKEIFEKAQVECLFGHVDVLDEEGRTNCFWCSWNKRKKLFELAREAGCNKIAFGHHKDDIAETMLLNLLFKGEISVMNPRQELFAGELTLIRPLSYVEEKMLKKFASENGFEAKVCQCPYGNTSKRTMIKDFLAKLEEEAPELSIKTNIFRSISRIKEEYIDLKSEVGKRG